MNWWAMRACRTAPEDLHGSDDQADIVEAKTFCAVCPSKAECLALADLVEPDDLQGMRGVMGGLDVGERVERRRGLACARPTGVGV